MRARGDEQGKGSDAECGAIVSPQKMTRGQEATAVMASESEDVCVVVQELCRSASKTCTPRSEGAWHTGGIHVVDAGKGR